MDRKAFLLEMRQSGQLKGLKPCFVVLKVNKGNIYNDGTSDFILSYRENTLYFQKITFFFHKLKPSEDIKYSISRFTSYAFVRKRASTILCLYDNDGNFLPIEYLTGTSESFSTEDNMERIAKYLSERGVKEIQNAEEFDTEGKGTDQKV